MNLALASASTHQLSLNGGRNLAGTGGKNLGFIKGFALTSDSGHQKLYYPNTRYSHAASPNSRGIIVAGTKGRSYPGGVTKWQWKRRKLMEEYKREMKRLEREKRLYRSRQREAVRTTRPWITSPIITDDVSAVSAGLETEVSSLGAVSALSSLQEGRSLRSSRLVNEDIESEQIKKVRSLLLSRATQPKDELASCRFEGLELSPSTLKALRIVLGLRHVTSIQKSALVLMRKGLDLLLRARGGKDELVTSLLHGIEVSLRLPRTRTISGRHRVHALLVCPTRELVEVARDEALKLLMFHTGIGFQIVMYGTNIKDEISRLEMLPCEILVATPGRLLAYMLESAEFRGQLDEVKFLALHDIQMLANMGYQETVQKIFSLLPKWRQSVMWSTTFTEEVHLMAHHSLTSNSFVADLLEGQTDESKALGKQEVVFVSMESHLPFIYQTLKSHYELEPTAKVLVFCQTIRTSTFMAALFKKLGFFARELHTRKAESLRLRVSSEFRISNEPIVLFTAGASVWGVANPDVSLVIQVGSPLGREQYVRRITSTVPTTRRKDCLLILMPHERSFLTDLGDLPVAVKEDVVIGAESEVEIGKAIKEVDHLVKAKAYIAWLKYHCSREFTESEKRRTVLLSNDYASALGFDARPVVSRETVKLLGLQSIFVSDRAEAGGN